MHYLFSYNEKHRKKTHLSKTLRKNNLLVTSLIMCDLFISIGEMLM